MCLQEAWLFSFIEQWSPHTHPDSQRRPLERGQQRQDLSGGIPTSLLAGAQIPQTALSLYELLQDVSPPSGFYNFRTCLLLFNLSSITFSPLEARNQVDKVIHIVVCGVLSDFMNKRNLENFGLFYLTSIT